MQKIIEFCQILGHQNNSSSHICTYHHCGIEYKLLCQICIQTKLHQHQLSNFDHIITIEEYNAKNNIINQQQLSLFAQDRSIKLSYLMNIDSREKINFIEISNSYENIALCRNYNYITIINMETKKERNSFKLKNQFKECKFSIDSKLLYLLDKNYNLYTYQLKNQRLASIKQIKKQEVIFFKPIKQGVICCSNNKIFIINMKQHKYVQCIKIKTSNKFRVLNALDYDHNNDVIITGSWFGNTIQILKRWNGKMLIQQRIQIHLVLIKFLCQNNDILFVCNKFQIVKCHIDYINKKITQLNIFNDILYERISFFNYFQSLEIIIVINQYKVMVLDSNLKQLQTIFHDAGQTISDFFLQVVNFDALKYIVIPVEKQCKVYNVVQQLEQAEYNLIIQNQK